jgi:hypothetical protein
MVIEYESQYIFRLGKSNSACEYVPTTSEYDSIKKIVDYWLGTINQTFFEHFSIQIS